MPVKPAADLCDDLRKCARECAHMNDVECIRSAIEKLQEPDHQPTAVSLVPCRAIQQRPNKG